MKVAQRVTVLCSGQPASCLVSSSRSSPLVEEPSCLYAGRGVRPVLMFAASLLSTRANALGA